VDAWLESSTLALLSESEHHWREMRAIVSAGHVTGPRIHDARIAAICLQHGVREIWTADRDFSRFVNLKTVNPLLA
jgi:predicted nucleic acid-binding protein